MGRGRSRSPARDVPGDVDRPRRYQVIVDDDAMVELVELLTYIKKESPKNAGSVRAAVKARLDRLARFPKTGHADPNAPVVPPGAAAFVTTVKKISLHYLFPLLVRDRDVVYVITIRRGSRMPLEEPEYLLRWMEELARMAPPLEEPRHG